MDVKDYVGRRCGRLVVLSIEKDKSYIIAVCKCDCGKICKKLLNNVVRGLTTSCGCFREALRKKGVHTTHGFSKTRLYNIWAGMKQRCSLESCRAYKNYGGRGIKVCEDWKNNFSAFYDWAIANGYKSNLTIDRINNDGDYCPENCRWATRQEQNNNTRYCHFVLINGQKLNLKQVSKQFNVPYSRLRMRILRGMDIMDAIRTPKQKN